MRDCVRACVRACVHACVRARVCVSIRPYRRKKTAGFEFQLFENTSNSEYSRSDPHATLRLKRHVKDEHPEHARRKDVAQDVAEGVLGVAPRRTGAGAWRCSSFPSLSSSSQRQNPRPTHACRPFPHAALGRHVNREERAYERRSAGYLWRLHQQSVHHFRCSACFCANSFSTNSALWSRTFGVPQGLSANRYRATILPSFFYFLFELKKGNPALGLSPCYHLNRG